MAATGTPTPNIGLRRPQGTDPASVDDINYNSALIDTKLGAVGNSSVQDQIDTLNSKIGNYAPKERRRIGNNAQATFTFESYATSAIIFAASDNTNGALYVFSNGYLAPIKTAINISFVLSSDYKTITVTNNTGTPIDVGCISTMYTPTVNE